MQYNFDWDPVKAKQNLRKHGVSFERAAKVFRDAFAISIYDDEHSDIMKTVGLQLGWRQMKYFLWLCIRFEGTMHNYHLFV